MKKAKRWHQYLWIISIVYLFLGLFNILFAWMGLVCFFVPLLIAIIKGNKSYCNRYCGRGQLLSLIGDNCKLSRNKPIPRFLKTKWFRYGFLAFFLAMFFNMLFYTVLVFQGTASLKEFVTLLWSINLPFKQSNSIAGISPWIYQFAYGFYSIMLTSTLLGILTMLLFKPRSWCVYCPMGTMTQFICKIKHSKNSVT